MCMKNKHWIILPKKLVSYGLLSAPFYSLIAMAYHHDELMTPEQIESRLQEARQSIINQNFTNQDVIANLSDNNVNSINEDFADKDFSDDLSHAKNSPKTKSAAPISLLDNPEVPLGLDIYHSTVQDFSLNTHQHSDYSHASRSLNFDLNSNDDEQQTDQKEQHDLFFVEEDIDVVRPVGFVRRLYDRLLNDGVSKVPRLKVYLYQNKAAFDSETEVDIVKLSRSEQKQEPFANIKAALEDITQDSVLNFTSALPRLRQTAMAAARAVGYYDLDLTIRKEEAGEIHVTIDRLGEPVRVDNRIVEVRGEGKNNPSYQQAIDEFSLQQGDIFNHGQYETSKIAVEHVSTEHGFLDGRWLDSSVDVILPDNIADVSLIYDSGDQYQFDQVVFFTIDPKTGQPTTDPDKLPVKASILNQLLNFQMGDAYNRQAVQDLTSDLLATGYFNTVNTEAIYPEQQASAEIEFEQINKFQDKTTSNTDAQSLLGQEVVVESVVLDDGTIAEFAPLQFTASQAIFDKLEQVAKKANALYDLPENRLLPVDLNENKSILARISETISNIAKAILPDEDKDLDTSVGRTQLQNKLTPQQVFANKKVPLYIFVAADKPRDAHLGLGWGSDSGMRMVGRFEHNLINKDGYQAGAEVRFSQKNKGLKLYGSKPLKHPLNDKLQASLSYEEESIDQSSGFDLSTKTLEQSISRNIVNTTGWNRSYSLRYRLDKLKTNAPKKTWEDLPVDFINGNPTQEVLLAGFALHKTVADDVMNPLRGYRHNYSLELGFKGLASDTNLAIARAGISGVHSFGDNAYGKARAHQIKGSLQGGYIWAKDFDAVPYKLRFFAGGDQSIRGYNYNSLAPISYKGYLQGGQSLAIGSLEYNYEVMKDLRLAMFGDVGGAYDAKFGDADTKFSAGLGVRWASPVGQLRVDIATGLKEKEHPIKLHFFIGSPF